MTEPLFAIKIADVSTVLLNSRRGMDYYDRLADRMPQFRMALKEELNLVVADAIEIAFLRTVPEATFGFMGSFVPCDICKGQNCTCLHPFKTSDHCLECLAWWSHNHSFSDCTTSPHIDVCSKHKDHTSDECEKSCILHKDS